MAMIMCSDCNSEMSDQASNCPKCGKPSKRSVGFLLGFGIFLIPLIFSWFTLRKGHTMIAKIISFSWLLFSILVALSMPNGTNNDTLSFQSSHTKVAEKAEEVIQVDIYNLLSDYKNNEVGADNKYKGKVIQVEGKIQSIKKDIMGNLYVTLGTGSDFEIPQVQAFFDDSMNAQLGALKKGSRLTVTCRINGLMMNVLAKNCVLE